MNNTEDKADMIAIAAGITVGFFFVKGLKATYQELIKWNDDLENSGLFRKEASVDGFPDRTEKA